MTETRSADRLDQENAELRRRLEEAEETLEAIRSGAVDAFLVDGADGECVYSLQTSDHPYRRLVESMKEGALTLDMDGCILFCNARFAELVGVQLERISGKCIHEFVPPELASQYEAMLRESASGTYRGELDLIRQDGPRVPVHWSVSRLDLGDTVILSAVATDLTEHRRYEALERTQEALSAEIASRILAEKNLIKADRKKDEFLAILAHELRNPLAPARNAVDYLKLNSASDPDLKRTVEILDRQVSHLSRLIDDLLDISRVTTGVLDLRRERISFAEVMDATIDACRDEVQRRGHDLVVRTPETMVELDADRDRLVQVLCNLTLNAAKYTPPGGHIALSATANGSALEISVKDDGIGIPREKLSEIFGLFSQVNRSFDRQGGLGVGLTLVRQLIRLHGGSVEARSAGLGRGSEFIVRIPVAVGPASQPPPEVLSTLRRRILIADDNQDAVESLAILLEVANHEVHKAYDGETAFATARDIQPDVILLDIGMPKMNGYEVATKIRREPWGKPIHLVALTGWGQEADQRNSREAGFDVHLVKPVTFGALNRLLATLEERREG